MFFVSAPIKAYSFSIFFQHFIFNINGNKIFIGIGRSKPNTSRHFPLYYASSAGLAQGFFITFIMFDFFILRFCRVSFSEKDLNALAEKLVKK